jgi:hypothetical protein
MAFCKYKRSGDIQQKHKISIRVLDGYQALGKAKKTVAG